MHLVKAWCQPSHERCQSGGVEPLSSILLADRHLFPVHRARSQLQDKQPCPQTLGRAASPPPVLMIRPRGGFGG